MFQTKILLMYLSENLQYLIINIENKNVKKVLFNKLNFEKLVICLYMVTKT